MRPRTCAQLKLHCSWEKRVVAIEVTRFCLTIPVAHAEASELLRPMASRMTFPLPLSLPAYFRLLLCSLYTARVSYCCSLHPLRPSRCDRAQSVNFYPPARSIPHCSSFPLFHSRHRSPWQTRPVALRILSQTFRSTLQPIGRYSRIASLRGKGPARYVCSSPCAPSIVGHALVYHQDALCFSAPLVKTEHYRCLISALHLLEACEIDCQRYRPFVPLRLPDQASLTKSFMILSTLRRISRIST